MITERGEERERREKGNEERVMMLVLKTCIRFPRTQRRNKIEEGNTSKNCFSK